MTMDYFTEAKRIFNIPRPKVFMDTPEHCEECQEVERNAQIASPDTLTLEQAGDGWAALHNYLNDDAFLYYCPAFIRLCIDTDMNNGFLENFFFAITYEEENNSRLRACNQEQRKFIHDFIVWYRNKKPELIEQWLIEEDVEKAIELWHV